MGLGRVMAPSTSWSEFPFDERRRSVSLTAGSGLGSPPVIFVLGVFFFGAGNLGVLRILQLKSDAAPESGLI